jgi:hypothetical protein
MHLERRDIRPPSLLDTRAFSTDQIVGGGAAILLAHIGLPIAIALITSYLSGVLGNKPPETFNEMHVVEARFVRLGKKPDPKKLPDRIVPRKSTAPDQQTVVSKNEHPDKPDKPDAGVRPEKPTPDPLTRIGDRAQAFAEIQEKEREQEGDPNGSADGTATEAQVGDIYLGKLVALFKRGWTIPSTIGDTSKLKVTTTFEITTNLRVGDFKIEQSSGEPLFDQSVEDRFQQMHDQDVELPAPPPEVADQFLGKTIGVRFKGTGAQ